MGQSVLGKREIEVNGEKTEIATVGGLLDNDVVFLQNFPPQTSPKTSPPPQPTDEGFYIARKKRHPTTGEIIWEFEPKEAGVSPVINFKLEDLDVDNGDKIRVVTLTVTTKAVEDPEAVARVYSDLALNPDHKRAGTPDSVFDKFAANPASVTEARRLPVIIKGNEIENGLDVDFYAGYDGTDSALEENLLKGDSTEDNHSISFILAGGNDGMRPTATEYEGTAKDTEPTKTGLKAFEDIEDISIVAAPGSTYGYANGYSKQASDDHQSPDFARRTDALSHCCIRQRRRSDDC